ncbi:hypothetical protein BDF22DRAFT_672290 [Syncephalis plumigaleata]|nr:hypothetical protein BDF22DRAFT_672290 [Syncephalis plumigaleata]
MLISCVYTIILTLVYTNVNTYPLQLSFSFSLFFTLDYVLRNHLYVYRIVLSLIPLITVVITHFHAVVSCKH